MPKTTRGKWQVVLHNDNRITFDHVIDALMDICGHNQLQAHQCALITHNKGQCSVYVDTYEACNTTSGYLLNVGLTTTVTKYETNH